MSAPQKVRHKPALHSTWLGNSRPSVFSAGAAGSAFHLAGKYGKAARDAKDARPMLIGTHSQTDWRAQEKTIVASVSIPRNPSQQPSPSASLSVRFQFELQFVWLRLFRLWLGIRSSSSNPGLETLKVAGNGKGIWQVSGLRCLFNRVLRFLPEYSSYFQFHTILRNSISVREFQNFRYFVKINMIKIFSQKYENS